MKRLRRLLSVIVVICIAASCLPLYALATTSQAETKPFELKALKLLLKV